MIDFLEVRVPVTTPRGPLWADKSVKPAQRVRISNYELMQDLSPHVPLKVYWDHRFNHDRKLEFVRVADLDANAILTSISQVFDVDPLGLELVRVDFAADVAIPLQWFAENLTVHRKRRRDGWGAETRRSRWEGTTLYFGKRPSVLRVYDKKAQLQSRGQEIPNGFQTRIEHQADRPTLKKMGLYTLGDLLQRAPELNPFESVRLPDEVTLRTATWRPPLKTHLASIGLMKELETMTRAQLELHYKNMGWPNAARDLDKLAPFTTTEVVEVPKLSDLFSASVTRQLFGEVQDLTAA